MSTEKATFAAGCFWGVEETFRHVKGVHATAVAYTGGHTSDPTYEDICYRNTGHAEVVHLDFDPDEVSFEELLTVFWQAHDPTQLNRQGPDVGDQYRSAIFFHSAEQEAAAKASKGDLDASGVHRSAIVTEITAAGPVHMAEDYHQQYVEKHNRGLFRQG